MCAALVGGMDRLKREYIEEARRFGIKLKCFTGKEQRISNRIGKADFVVLFTDKLSHKARRDVMGKNKGRTQLYMSHSSGVTSLRKCLQEAMQE